MEALNSAETTLQWFWMIEYLTTLQQVDTRVLNDLVEEAPPFPADLKSKVEELIALRALEEICKDGDKSGDSGNKVGIDLSETCLSVLNCILKEASVSDIMTRKKPLQFDIRPFILHKRATMPKSALQQMFSEKQFVYNQGPIKETAVSCAFISQMPEKPLHNPNFASLNNDLEGGSTSKESFPIDTENFAHEDQSGRGEADFLLPNAKKLKQTVPNSSETELRVPNPSEKENSAAVPDGGAGFFEGVELGNEASHTVANGNSNSDSLKSGSGVLGGDLSRSSVLPLKKRFFEYSGNLAENLQECQQNREDPDLPPNAKKLRRSALEPEVKSAVVNVNGRTDAEIVGGETIKENSVNCVKPREISDSGSKHKHFVQESTATVVSADGFVEKAKNRISADGLQHKEDIVEHNSEFDLDMNMEQVTHKDPTSSRDDIDVTLKQMESSSSKEQKACVKCNQGSQLLVCQVEDCALVVHAKCLGLSDGFCVFGSFYCPSCAYADAEKEYREAEMEASLLRANLDTFLYSGFGVDIANIRAESQNLAGNDQTELDISKKGGNQEKCEERVVEDEVTNPEGMNLGQDHGNGGSSHEDHEEHVEKHSDGDCDGGVCVSEEHVLVIEDSDEETNEDDQNELDSSKKGGTHERCEEKVVEDEVTNPEGMNNGGSSHEDHEEHVEKHSDADFVVCVSEKHVLLIEDSDGGTNEDEVYSVILATDEAETIEEALDDLHADGCRTPEHEHHNQLSDESPRSPTEEEAKKHKETKVMTPWKKLINFGTSIFMAGLGGSEHGKK